MSESSKRIGEVLVEVGVITREQFEKACAEQSQAAARTDLSEVLIRMGFATEAQIIKGIGIKDQISYFEDLEPFLTEESPTFLPEKFCRTYQTAPLFKQDNQLMIATVNPYDIEVADVVMRQTGLTVQPVLSTRKAISSAIDRMFKHDSDEGFQSVVSQAAQQIQDVSAEGRDEPDTEYTSFEVDVPIDLADSSHEQVDVAPVIKIVNQIMLGAINKKASDIHVEPRADKLIVRYRVDGVLSEVMSLPRPFAPAVVSRIKIIARLDISEMRKPQDGRIRLRLKDRSVDLRVSTLPLVTGEKAVMRILDKDDSLQDLNRIGFPPAMLVDFKKNIHTPNGIILVTGPTGSGKTTTLYAALNEVKDDTQNISTLEDPVEFQMTGVNQVSVNQAVGMTFAAGLRALLRQDPDVVLVGEIRDIETAKISIQAALTGHLVLSTLHTNSACGAIARILDMDVEPFLLSSALRAVVAQRLLRLLCPHCREAYEPDSTMVRRVGLGGKPGPFKFYRPRGCERCSQSGYRRRAGIYEQLTVTPEIMDKIQTRATEQELFETARRNGFTTMFEHGVAKLLKGETSVEELLRVATA